MKHWIRCSVMMFIVGVCCGHLAAQQYDRRQSIAENTAGDSSQDDTQVNTMPELSPAVLPIPDPISEKLEPIVSWSQAVAAPAIAKKERLPRALLITSQHCAPCERMKRELQGFSGKSDTPIFDNLLGDSSAPVELVENWKANDLEKLGITPGMLQGTPTLIVLDANGKVHGLSPNGLGCKLQGYHPRAGVILYLTQPDHAVAVEPVADPEPVESPAIATVENAEPTAETFAAVLSEHLMRSSGQETQGPFLVGGLFDFSITVDQSWKNIALKIFSSEKIDFPTAGLTIDWSGPERTFAIAQGKITVTPPIKVSVKKWVFSYSAGLNGVVFADDLSSVTIDLSGSPDVTIRLVSMAKYMAPWLSRELKDPAAVIDRTLVP